MELDERHEAVKVRFKDHSLEPDRLPLSPKSALLSPHGVVASRRFRATPEGGCRHGCAWLTTVFSMRDRTCRSKAARTRTSKAPRPARNRHGRQAPAPGSLQRVILPCYLLGTLRNLELAQTAKDIAADTVAWSTGPWPTRSAWPASTYAL